VAVAMAGLLRPIALLIGGNTERHDPRRAAGECGRCQGLINGKSWAPTAARPSPRSPSSARRRRRHRNRRSIMSGRLPVRWRRQRTVSRPRRRLHSCRPARATICSQAAAAEYVLIAARRRSALSVAAGRHPDRLRPTLTPTARLCPSGRMVRPIDLSAAGRSPHRGGRRRKNSPYSSAP